MINSQLELFKDYPYIKDDLSGKQLHDEINKLWYYLSEDFGIMPITNVLGNLSDMAVYKYTKLLLNNVLKQLLQLALTDKYKERMPVIVTINSNYQLNTSLFRVYESFGNKCYYYLSDVYPDIRNFIVDLLKS